MIDLEEDRTGSRLRFGDFVYVDSCDFQLGYLGVCLDDHEDEDKRAVYVYGDIHGVRLAKVCYMKKWNITEKQFKEYLRVMHQCAIEIKGIVPDWHPNEYDFKKIIDSLGKRSED